MASDEDIIHFTHSDILKRLAEFGFATPAVREHFDTPEDVIRFLSSHPQRYIIAVDYMYYRECIGSSTMYPMWCVQYVGE